MENDTVRNRKKLSCELRHDLSVDKKIKQARKFCVALPKIESHKGHSTSKVRYPSLRKIK